MRNKTIKTKIESAYFQEARRIKKYLEDNNYISDIFEEIHYSFSQRELEGKNVHEIAEKLKSIILDVEECIQDQSEESEEI